MALPLESVIQIEGTVRTRKAKAKSVEGAGPAAVSLLPILLMPLQMADPISPKKRLKLSWGGLFF